MNINSEIENILNDRKETHGDFHQHAKIAQAMKNVFEENICTALSDSQREAIHMVFHKFARIASGNPDTEDHWLDSIGYLTLALKDVRERNRVTQDIQGVSCGYATLTM